MKEQTSNSTSVWAALARPFSFEAVHVKVLATNREKTRGLIAPYVDARGVMDRLDSVVGPDNWSDSYALLEGGAARCALTIGRVTKEDVGEGDNPKSAFSDALKRAAVKFGVGRYLYDTETVWIDLNERGQIAEAEEAKRRLLATPAPNGKRLANRPEASRLRSSDELTLTDANHRF